MTQYSTILSTSRRRASAFPGRTLLTESESDRGRVLFCPAFRRLQQKAQVFSMEPNAAVRSRLTHSLEVSQIGRYIADEVGQKLLASNSINTDEQSALINFVETACLMHDIGNPPFGHFGEAAIQDWFRTNGRECIRSALDVTNEAPHLDDIEINRALADFHEFDGNPQGLRVVGRLQWNTDEYGLNLTYTTLASYLKYIRSAGDSDNGKFKKKAGFFSTEAAIVKDVWREFNYTTPKRFPLAYIMEAADDIAYCVSDLEDSFEKDLIYRPAALEEIEKRYLKLGFSNSHPLHVAIRDAVTSVKEEKRDGKDFTFTDFRTTLNRLIVQDVAQRYVEKHDAVIAGSLETLLPKDEPAGAILDVLKSYCLENVYRHESIQRTELAGYTAIMGLLDHFKPLLEASENRFRAALDYKKKDSDEKPIVTESKILKLFPEKHKRTYEHHLQEICSDDTSKYKEWNARAHLVVDFVSGMTDDFLMTTYRTLAGMRL